MRSAFWTPGRLAYYRLRGCKSALIGTNCGNRRATCGQPGFPFECEWSLHETSQPPRILYAICQPQFTPTTSPVFVRLPIPGAWFQKTPVFPHRRPDWVRRAYSRNQSAAFPLRGRMSASYSPNALRSIPVTPDSQATMHTSVVERGGWLWALPCSLTPTAELIYRP